MEPFLRQVANYLYTSHRAELSELCLVFPGRRAGVFFTAYLNELVEQPVLSPEVTTISELVSSLTDLQQADPVSLVIRLHEVYTKETGHVETLDEFFFWGEILLSDFDDIDKYLLNADDLFRNISDLKELEAQFDYLTEEQKRAIDEFWGNLDKVPHSFNKDKFIAIWKKLAGIYHQFRASLREEKMAYPGMIYRDVAERFMELIPQPGPTKYVFIGFNALNECEKAIFKKLEKTGKALFFWDYGDFYLKNPENEAGRFLRTNMVQFPSPKSFFREDDPSLAKKKVTLISVPGNITQAQAINLTQVLEQFPVESRFDNTAMVLADENLLIPVISSVGSHFPSINITMGYPFVNTPVYGFISQLISLQRNIRRSSGSVVFYYKHVVAILNHQFVITPEIRDFVASVHQKNKIYISSSDLAFSSFLSKVFSHPEDWKSLLDYFLDILKDLSLRFDSLENEQVKLEAEYLFQAYLAIQRLKETMEGIDMPDFPVKILFRLLDQCLRRINIPFEGEPLTGLQIMGLLETRCLDFRNLVLFSANEGFLPRISPGQSFVPYHLRKGFGMPTYEDRDAMYAYYFYRLLHRSERVVVVFNSVTEGVSFSEKSRFLYQLQYDSDFEIEELNLSFNFKNSVNEALEIQSTSAHVERLAEKYSDKNLSPSAINTYLDCKLKFYFKYVAGIKESDELKEEIDAVVFGNLFHYAMELLCGPFVGKTVEAHALKLLRGDKRRIEEVVKQSVAVQYYKLSPEEAPRFELTGQSRLIASHIKSYIEQLLENDIRFAPFEIVSLEKEYSERYPVYLGTRQISVQVGGIVDRIDRTADGLRIIDYKTGRNLKLDFKEWQQLTDSAMHDRRKEIFQTLIYSDILLKNKEYAPIYPAIYKLDNLFDDDFVPNVIFRGQKVVYQEVQSEFEQVFSGVLTEMFTVGNVFSQTTDAQKCKYCPYNSICRR